jgi:putative peptidoglycan lipid II flippase
MQALVARAFYSMQNTVIPVVTGTIMTAIFIPMNYGLMKLMGFTGLALATTIAATGHTIIMMYLLQKKAGGIGGKRLLTSFVKISAASAVMGASMWATLIGVQTLLPANMPFKTAAGVRLLLPMLVGGTLFVLMIRALKLEESAVVLDMIKRRFYRRRATSDS